MTQTTFVDLEIRIFPRQEEGYPVEIRLDGQQEFPRGYLHADILSWIPSGNSLTDGQNLFNFLFDDKSLHRAWHQAVGQSPHRRIRLWIDTDAPELHTIPWELLHTGETFLAADAATPLSRYLPGVATWGRAVLQGSLRVLAVIANPADLAEYGLVSLDIEQERSVLDAAFAALPPNRRHLDFLDAPVTLARLEDRLHAGYHILHFVGHGAFNQRQKQAGLYLQDLQGNTETVAADAFGSMLKRLDQRPHLVFLAACQTAKRDTANAFVGFGPELVRADIPVVLAMQGDIVIPTAQTLSHTFYQQLVRHGRVDLAFNEARSTLLTTQRSDAAMPVLFMRLKDGQLWAPPERHDFYRHIPSPLHYLPRPDLLETIKTALLDNADGLALTAAIQMNALHGMGGIGKTVIARALCDDPDVQTAFPDGILWTTLGSSVTEAELRIKLREWLNYLGGVVGGEAPTQNELKAALVQTLENRACLLIVDDVWQRTHAEVFQVGGTGCRLLLTTRDAEIAHALGASLQPVDVLSEPQAVALLEQWAEGHLDDTALHLKQRIVARLGCLPLALKLAGAQLRDEAAEVWLQAFTIGDLEAPRIESPHDSLVTTFAHSLDQLSSQDRQCYVSLAIFREDEPVPVAAITKLWEAQSGLNQRKVIRLLKDLAARALLQITETPDELEVTLHDLLRDFITAELGEQGMRVAHRALLDAYHTTKTGTGWHTAPDDGYLYAHLAYHLDAVEDYTALSVLFADDAWLHARVPSDDYIYDGYLADLSITWSRAQAAVMLREEEAQLPSVVADCVHYALVNTSVNALAGNYVPELVARAVEISLWSPERGMSIARHIVDADKCAEMATSLLKVQCLPEILRGNMQRLGLAAARAIGNERRQTEILTALVPQLTGTLLAEGLAAVRASGGEGLRAKVLAALAPQLTRALLAEELAAARVIEDEGDRAEVLATLAPQLTGTLLGEGLATARAIGDEWRRAEVLAALAPQLTGALLAEGLAAARAIGDEVKRARVLAALAPQLTGAARETALAEGLAAVRAMKDEWRQAEVLAALAPQLAGALLAEGLAAVRAIRDAGWQAWVLMALAPQLTGALLVEGLTAARAIGDEGLRAEVLAALAPQLTEAAREAALAEVLMAARAIEDEGKQVRVLVALAPQLTGALLAEGLAAARAIEDEGLRMKVLAALAPQLTGALLAEGLAAARTIGDEGLRMKVLAALAPQLTRALLAEELAAARAFGDEWKRAEVLAALALQLTGAAREAALTEGLTAACAIEDEARRAEVLAALAPQLTGALLAEGLAAARTIGDEVKRVKVLAALAPQLTGAARRAVLAEGLTEGLTAARAIWIWDEERRTRVLATLAPQLTGTLLAEGLTAARALRNEGLRAQVLVALAPQLTGELLTEGLAAARALRKKGDRAEVLAALAPQLTGAAREAALSEVLTVVCVLRNTEPRVKVFALQPGAVRELAAVGAIWNWDEERRARVLAALAPQLTGALLAEGLAAARVIRDKGRRAEVLAALASQLTGAAREAALTEGLAAARAIGDEARRVEVLASLALQLTGAAREAALAEGMAVAHVIRDEGSRADVLVVLAPQLTRALLAEGLAAARAIGDELNRAKVLVALALSTNTPDSILKDIRRALLDYLWNMRTRERATLLDSLAQDDLAFLRALGISQEGYEQIAQSVIAICTQWEWL